MHNMNVKKKHVVKFKNICVGIDTVLELKTLGHAGDSYNDVIKNLIAAYKVTIIR